MPIINLCGPKDKGAVGHHYGAGGISCGYDEVERRYLYEGQGPRAYWTRLSHVGLCLQDREMNGYDDSDFYMTVWNWEKHEPESILFATTRAWTYPCMGSSVDATPEVRRAYEQFLDGEARARRIVLRQAQAKELREWRRELKAAAKAHGARYTRLLKCRRTLLKADLEKVVKLLTTKVRNSFKLQLRQQVVKWTLDPNPQYATPLSRKQLEWIS